MSRVPESVDELMWLVAEQNEPAAIEAFDRRYPEFRKEMMARLEMVRGMRAARPAAVRSIPVFQPTVRTVRPFGLPRWALAGAASVLFFGVGFASFKAIEANRAPSPIAVVETQPVAVQTPVTTPFKATSSRNPATAPCSKFCRRRIAQRRSSVAAMSWRWAPFAPLMRWVCASRRTCR